LSAKIVSTFADRECDVVSVTDLYGRILGFLDRTMPYYKGIYRASSENARTVKFLSQYRLYTGRDSNSGLPNIQARRSTTSAEL
jgi:hypothetical protein